MKLKLEDWTSLASLGLSAMFVALLLSFYIFLIGPEGQGPERVVEPGSLLIQIIFISVAPSLALAGSAFAMVRAYGSPIAGMFLIATGIILVVGMSIGITMVPRIQSQYIVGAVAIAPYLFMPAGAGVAAVGVYMLVVSQKRHVHSRDLDDLR